MAKLIDKINYLKIGINNAWKALSDRGIELKNKDIKTLGEYIANIPYSKPTQEKTVMPTRSNLEVLPDEGYFLDKVNVQGSSSLQPYNIKKDVEIFGVTGTVNINLEPLHDFNEVILPEEISAGTKYYFILSNKSILFSHATQSGIWLVDFDTQSVSKILDSGVIYNTFAEYGDKCLITSSNSAGVGINIYDSKSKTITQLFPTGYNYKVISAGTKHLIITSSSTANGFFIYNIEDNTIQQIIDTGMNYSAIFTMKDEFSLIASTTSSSAYKGLYLYDFKSSLFNILNSAGSGWSIISETSNKIYLYQKQNDSNALGISMVKKEDRTYIRSPITGGYNFSFKHIENVGILVYGSITGVYFYDYSQDTINSAGAGITQSNWQLSVAENNNYLMSCAASAEGGMFVFNVDTKQISNSVFGTNNAGRYWCLTPHKLKDNEYLMYNTGASSAQSQGLVYYNSLTGILTRVYIGGINASVMDKIFILSNGDAFIYSSTASNAFQGVGLFNIESKTFTQLYTLGYNWNIATSIGTSGDYLISTPLTTANSTGLLWYKKSAATITAVVTTGSYDVYQSVGTDGDCLIGNKGTYGLYFYDRSATTVTQIYSTGTFNLFRQVGTDWLAISGAVTTANPPVGSGAVGIALYKNNDTTTAKYAITNTTHCYDLFHPVQNGLLMSGKIADTGVLFYNSINYSITKVYASGAWNTYTDIGTGANTNTLIYSDIKFSPYSTQTGILMFQNSTKKVLSKNSTSGSWNTVISLNNSTQYYILYNDSSSTSYSAGIFLINNGIDADATKIVSQPITIGYSLTYHRVGQYYLFYSLANPAITSGGTGVIVIDTSKSTPTFTVAYDIGNYWDQIAVIGNDALLSSSKSGTLSSTSYSCNGILLFNGTTKAVTLVNGTTASSVGNYGYSYNIDKTTLLVHGGALVRMGAYYNYASGLWYFDSSVKTLTQKSNLIPRPVGYIDRNKYVIVYSDVNESVLIYDKNAKTITQISNSQAAWEVWKELTDRCILRNIYSSAGTAYRERGYRIFNDNDGTIESVIGAGYDSASATLDVQDGTLIFPSSTNNPTWHFDPITNEFTNLGNVGCGTSLVSYDIDSDTILIALSSSSVVLYNKTTRIIESYYSSISTGSTPSIITIDDDHYLMITASSSIPTIYNKKTRRIYKASDTNVTKANLCIIYHNEYVYLSDKGTANGLVRYDLNKNTFLKVLKNGKAFEKMYNDSIISTAIPIQVFSFNTSTMKSDIFFSGTVDDFYIYNDGIIQKLSTGKFITFNETFVTTTLQNTGINVGTTNVIYRVREPLDEFEEIL